MNKVRWPSWPLGLMMETTFLADSPDGKWLRFFLHGFLMSRLFLCWFRTEMNDWFVMTKFDVAVIMTALLALVWFTVNIIVSYRVQHSLYLRRCSSPRYSDDGVSYKNSVIFSVFE